jgi:hydroxyacyl-ACP dehydratase HTD2-like protein with hotdog domain
MMVATMTLEVAATEFVDASATRFAYRGLGPAMVNAPRSRDNAPFCGAR